MKPRRRRVRAFLLVYYEQYRANAEREFRLFLDDLGTEYTLTIINNNLKLATSFPHDIVGDNRNREFTGWDNGISDLGVIKADEFFLFANDTFCAHRPWHKNYQGRFKAAFRNAILRDEASITGEIDAVWSPFSIAGKRTDQWVSTYLFGLTGQALLDLGSRLSLSEEALQSMVHSISGTTINWGPQIDDSLRQHLQRWMFPDDGNAGWYNSGQGDDQSNLGKLRCILNEKYISAAVKDNGGKLVGLPANSVRMFVSEAAKKVIKFALTCIRRS